MAINKAVILAGGLGTRMLPATNNINKHLLPVYTDLGAIPMLYFPISTIVKSGIKEILIISSREHCGRIIENLGDGREFNADFTYKIQDVKYTSLGIASALKISQDFVGNKNFAVILGDNYFEDSFINEFNNFDNGASIFLKNVKNPRRFGVYSNNSIEEKPKNPKSNMAVTGLYLYSSDVFGFVKKLKVSKRGELEITDVNNFYCKNNLIKVNKVKGFWSDMGTPESIDQTQRFLKSKFLVNNTASHRLGEVTYKLYY